ncbi:MAG: EGF domain-containing protein [Deltaproteobacteria bacterium]|nr:EGF domain-containing protein [Deltaproteobacteria bacterium]
MKPFQAGATLLVLSLITVTTGCGSGGGRSPDSGTITAGSGGSGVDAMSAGGMGLGSTGGTGIDAMVAEGGSGGSVVPDAAADALAADGGRADAEGADTAVNECEATIKPCSANAICTDTPSSYTCECKAGYSGNGVTCVDVDECATNNGGCSADAICSNTAGARECTCKSGFSGDGITCVDINECATNNGDCDSLVVCTNTPGSHTCGNCPAGYSGGGAGACTDINECTSGTANCAADADCTNSAGSFSCTCKGGFTGTGASCNACATCAAGSYETAACTATTDTTCGACPSGCTTCSSASICTACAPGHYMYLGMCVPCSTCGDGQYQSSACSATQNTVCTSCSVCGNGQYQTMACAATTNATCSTCSVCPVGKYASTACTATSDTVCGTCDAGCDACSGTGQCTVCSAGYALNGGSCVKKGKSCLALHTGDSQLPDGIYQLDPDAAGAGEPFFAYCDMTTDGGGWMKILQYKDAAYTPTSAAVGTIAVAGTNAMAKMADANVNALAKIWPQREYRFAGATSTKKLFIKSSVDWNDTARGEGLVLTGTTMACESTTNCTYVSVTTPGGRPTIDSNDWTPSSIAGANNIDRYFTDYSAPIHCFATNDSTKRCYCSGATTNHAMIQNLSIWVREDPISSAAVLTYQADENAGATVADSSGRMLNATLVSGTWDVGHTGSGIAGAFVTNADVPVTTDVTVSLWVRRDGAGNAYSRILGWQNDRLELADFASQGKLGVYTPGIGWQNTGVTFASGFHHVAVTVGGGTVTVYYDGVSVYTHAGSVNLSGPIMLGRRWSGGEAWVGAIDQVRVFNTALSAAQIAVLAQE